MERTRDQHKLIECKQGCAIVLPYPDNLTQDIPLFQRDKDGKVRKTDRILRQTKSGKVHTI